MEAALVGVVLDADKVEPRLVGGHDLAHRGVRLGGVRDGEDAELDAQTSPTTLAIAITPVTQRTMPMTSKMAPVLIMRVIGSMPDE